MKRKLSLGDCSPTLPPHRSHITERLDSAYGFGTSSDPRDLGLTLLAVKTMDEKSPMALRLTDAVTQQHYQQFASVLPHNQFRALLVVYCSDTFSVVKHANTTGGFSEVFGDHPWGLVKVWVLPDFKSLVPTPRQAARALEQAFDNERAKVAHFVERYQRLSISAESLWCKVIVFMRTTHDRPEYCFMVRPTAFYRYRRSHNIVSQCFKVFNKGWKSLDDLEDCLNFIRDCLEGAQIQLNVRRKQPTTKTSMSGEN